MIDEIFHHQMQQAEGEMECLGNWLYSLISGQLYFRGLTVCNQVIQRAAWGPVEPRIYIAIWATGASCTGVLWGYGHIARLVHRLGRQNDGGQKHLLLYSHTHESRQGCGSRQGWACTPAQLFCTTPFFYGGPSKPSHYLPSNARGLQLSSNRNSPMFSAEVRGLPVRLCCATGTSPLFSACSVPQ